MDHSENMTSGTFSSPPPHGGSQSSSTAPSSPQVVVSPCAACKILRRRCVEKCILAPYFPPTQPLKFTIAHKVFGASNIIKLLQELPESQRVDAVNSLVYEANARNRDPVYGCAGAISHLQNEIIELQAQLAKAQAQAFNFQCQNSNLLSIIYCMGISSPSHHQQLNSDNNFETDQTDDEYTSMFLDDGNYIGGASWEQPLWA